MELDSLKWMSILSHAMVVGSLRRVMFLIVMEDEVVGIFMWIYASNTFSVSMLKQVIYASNTFTVSMLKHLCGLAGGERRRLGTEAEGGLGGRYGRVSSSCLLSTYFPRGID